MREPEEKVYVGLKPLTLPQLFDEIFSLYRKNFMLFFGIVGLVYIPIGILNGFISMGSVPADFFSTDTSQTSFNPLDFVTGILTWIAAAAAMAALSKAISERYLGRDATITRSYNFILGRLPAYLFTLIMVILSMAVGALLLLIGLIIALFWFAFVNPVFVIEGRAYSDAMKRSRELAKGNWSRIFLVGLLTFLLTFLVELGASAIAGLIFNPFESASLPMFAFLSNALTGIADAFVLPIGLMGTVLLYFDIRVREEGYDLELLAKDLEARSQSGTPLS